jgi:regulator of protease activity HflC (stomatin/prohibitin superfamily)
MELNLSKATLSNAAANSIIAKLIIKAVVGGFIAISPFCLTIVNEHQLVTVSRLGKLNTTFTESGLHWFWPLIDTVHRYDTRPVIFNIDLADKSEKDSEQLLGIGAQTKEGWHIGVVVHTSYTLDKSKALRIIETFGEDDTQESRAAIASRLDSEIKHAIQNLTPQYNINYILTHRDELGNNAQAVLGLFDKNKADEINVRNGSKISLPLPLKPNTTLNDIGIKLDHISFELNIPKAYQAERNKAALFQEQSATYSQQLNTLEKSKAAKEKELEIANQETRKKAETQAYVLETLNQQRRNTPKFIAFFEKWDGKLPQVVTNDSAISSMLDDAAKDYKERTSGSKK